MVLLQRKRKEQRIHNSTWRVDAFSLNLSNSQLAAVMVDRSILDRRAGIEAYFVIKTFGVGRSGEPMANGVFGAFPRSSPLLPGTGNA